MRGGVSQLRAKRSGVTQGRANAQLRVMYTKVGVDASAGAAVTETAALYTGDGTTSVINFMVRYVGPMGFSASLDGATLIVVWQLNVRDSGGSLVDSAQIDTVDIVDDGTGDVVPGGVYQASVLAPFTPIAIPASGYVTFEADKIGGGAATGAYYVDIYIG